MDKRKCRNTWKIVIVVAWFLLTGMSAVLLTEKFGWKLDLTENKLYTLSEETIEILSELEEPVTITVFNQEAEYPLLPKNLLEKYSKYGTNISVCYCDPYLEPKKVRLYEEMGYAIELNDMLIEAAGRYHQLKLEDLYQLDASKTQIEKLAAEQEITAGIHLVANGERQKVLFTDGHGEEPSASLMELFSMNHYQTFYTELSVQGIDEDAELLVVCAPRRDFSVDEIRLMEEYLEKGKGIMLFWAPGTENMPNLTAFLNDWGIAPTNYLIEEPDLYVSGSGLNVAATYGAHEINEFFSNNRYYVIVPSCVALEQVYMKRGTTETKQVLRSSTDAEIEELTEKGPFNLVLSSTRDITTDDGERVNGKVLVFGSKQIYGDDMLASKKMANRDFLIQAAGWCVEEESLINIPPKEIGHKLLPVVASESRKWAVLMIGVLPLTILAVGAGIVLRRRYL